MPSHQIYEPHPSLRPYVRYYWTLDIRLEGKSMLDLQVTADRFPRIVIQCLNGLNALHSADYRSIYAASLKGVTSKPALVNMEPTYSHVAVSLYPHGLKALFGIDGSETADEVVDLNHFIPREVTEKIMGATLVQTRLQLLEASLLKQVRKSTTVDARVLNFLQLCPATNYGNQLRSYGISERQFERKFLQTIGLTPSYYRRMLRFENAFYRIQHNQFKSLADLAYELGYADQSHFNREFKQLSGQTPLVTLTKAKLVKESGSMLTE